MMRSEGRAKPERASSNAAQVFFHIRYIVDTQCKYTQPAFHPVCQNPFVIKTQTVWVGNIAAPSRLSNIKPHVSYFWRYANAVATVAWLFDPYCPADQVQLFNTGTDRRVAGQPVSVAVRGARKRSASQWSNLPSWSKPNHCERNTLPTAWSPWNVCEVMAGYARTKVKPSDIYYDDVGARGQHHKGGDLIIQQIQVSIQRRHSVKRITTKRL